MPSDEFQDAMRKIRAILSLPPKIEEPVLVILSGLPGSGKTTFAVKLGEALPAIVIESDFVRKTLFPKPTYSGQEDRLIHAVARALMRHYLRTGHSVIADATNIAEWQRQILRRLAQLSRVPGIVVQTCAPEEVIAARLHHRSVHKKRSDFSEADWRVYQSMSGRAEPIRGPHLRVDTTQNLDRSVKRIGRAVERARRQLGNSSPSRSATPTRTRPRLT
jgi:predicted kinase